MANPTDCACDGVTLTTIYRMYNSKKAKHLYTNSLAEKTTDLANGYSVESNFYCASSPGQCGATLAFLRYSSMVIS